MKNSSKGFTIIELLFAFAVLSIVVAGATGFFTQGLQFTSYNEDKLSAVHLASLVLEKVQENFSETACPNPDTNLFPSYQHLFEGLDVNGAFVLNEKHYFITLLLYCDPAKAFQTLHVQVFDSVRREQLLSQNFGYVQLQSGGSAS